MKSAALLGSGRVGTIFGVDIPATKKQSTLKVQYGYLVNDNWLGAKKFNKILENSGYQSDFSEFKEAFEPHSNHDLDQFHINDPRSAALNMISSVNASSGALDAWQEVMDLTTASVYARIAEMSSVSSAESIQKFIETLPPEQRSRSHIAVVPGEDHNIGNVKLMKRNTDWAHEAFAA